jgi:hypothetical protein
MPRRKRQRAPRYLRNATVEMLASRQSSEGHLLNISLTGALLRLPLTAREGTRVRLFFPATAPGVALTAKVVRIASAAASIHSQVGLKFYPQSALEQQLIRGVLYNKKMVGMFNGLNFNSAKLQNLAVVLLLTLKIALYFVLPVFILLSLFA